MIIIIGLGNPGAQYKNTRHNVGFMAINEFAKKNDFPEFKLSPYGGSAAGRQKKPAFLISEALIGEKKIVLGKPQTFMNESGKAVKEVIKNKPAENLVVIHDDIDLPAGKIKIVTERGSAGHKGVESIIKSIGNDGLIRFRIGIGSEKKQEAMKIVLKNFSPDEKKIIDEAIKKTVDALELFVKEGLEKTMNEYNK